MHVLKLQEFFGGIKRVHVRRWSITFTFKHRADLGDNVVSEVLSLDITFHSSSQCLAFHWSWTHLTGANESKGLELEIPHITFVFYHSSFDGRHKSFGFKKRAYEGFGTNNHNPTWKWVSLWFQRVSSTTVVRFANISCSMNSRHALAVRAPQ